MNIDQVRDKWRNTILRLAGQHGVLNVRVFGSVARGESTERSDVDLLVEMLPGRSYLDFVAFWQDVEEALGCSVDVVDDGGISPYLRERILREAIPL